MNRRAQQDEQQGSKAHSTPKPVTWEAFQKKYLQKEDAYKYEWVDGQVEKTRRTMDFKQFYIAQNLLNLFYRLKAEGKTSGSLITEGDVFFGKNHRRPDMAFFTAEQIAQAAEGINPVPDFVIEIISNNDAINRVQAKMQDYRNAGVQVVWHIFPLTREVNIYGGEALREMKVHAGAMLCSAAPVISALEISVEDLFGHK